MADYQGVEFVLGVTLNYFGQMRERVRVSFLLFAYLLFYLWSLLYVMGSSVRIPPRQGLSTYKKAIQ